jgi:type II secretory pathway component GspD/PulD (secretin)
MKMTLMAIVAAAGMAAAGTNRVFKTHSLGFTDTAAAEQTARSIVSPGGNVVLDRANNRLLVFATDEEHAQLAGLAAELAAPPKVVRIEVRHSGGGRQTERSGSLGISGSGIVAPGGSAGTLRLNPSLTHTTTDTRDNAVQTLTVSSGRSATLHVGEDVPYVGWLVTRAMDWGLLQGVIQWQKVGAFLAVEPTVIGEGPQALIRVRLTPELSGIVDGNPYRIRYQRAATEVVVAPGQTIQIGGATQDREFYSRFLIGMSRGGEHHTVSIELTPTIVEMAAPSGAPPR